MIPAESYYSFFIILVYFLSIIAIVKINNNNNYTYTNLSMFLLMWIVVIYIGIRPVHPIFADMTGYVRIYEQESLYPSSWSEIYYSEDKRNEWLWQFIYMICARFGLPSWGWLIIVALGYIGIGAIAIKRIFNKNNRYIAFLFYISAFSFFSYAVNGMRNGLSFSIVLLAFTYLRHNQRSFLKYFLLSFIAYNIHHTALLPLTCAFITYFIKKESNIALYIWLLSIPLSLAAHSYFESILIGISPDERLNDYVSSQYQIGGIGSSFSSSGFRWDFLLYSSMPILLGYYVKRKVNNEMLSFLLNTYLLCNSFWILVIRASFSNRFAYLSWFIYPILLAYPLLEVKFSNYQKKWLCCVMLAHISFTAIMHFIYYA